MHRNTKIIIAFTIVFFLLFGGGYFYLKKQQEPIGSPFMAVPVNAAIVIEIKKPQVFIKELGSNQVAEPFKSITDGTKIVRAISFIDSVISNNSKIGQKIAGIPAVISIHELSPEQYGCLIVLPIGSFLNGYKTIDEIVNLSGKFGSIATTKYSQAKIHHFVKKGKNQRNLFITFIHGFLLLATDELLIQDAIRQTESNMGIEQNKSFAKVKQSAGKHVDANIYLQYKQFAILSKKWFASDIFSDLTVNAFSDWGESDLNIKNNTWLLNGFSVGGPDKGRWDNLFKDQSPQSTNLTQKIPMGIQGFSWFGLSNLSTYFSSFANYMDNIGQTNRYQTNRTQVISTFGSGFFDQLEYLFGKELVQISMPDGSNLFLMGMKGKVEARNFIKYMVDNGIKSDPQNYKIDNETSFDIYQLPLTQLPARVFGPWFNACKAQNICCIDNIIVFADSYSAITKFLYDNVLQKNLQFDIKFNQFNNYLANQANFYLYISLTSSNGLLSHLLNQNAYSYYSSNQEALHDYYGFAWQFACNSELLYHNCLIRYQPTETSQTTTEWETHLDTLVAFKPILVENHTTREKEIFAQDMKNNIYLINNAGRIIWKKQIEEPIIGGVEQVDYYRNGKLQYLFNTSSAIYILDRNGNPVERYPQALPEKTDLPVAVFDYENTRNYRLFAACRDKQIVALSIDGKTIPGFGFNKTSSQPVAPIQHFVDKALDYIAITDAGRIYLVDRQGKTRVEYNETFSPSVNNVIEYLPAINKNTSMLVRTSSDGTIYYLKFDGTIEKKKLASFSEKHFFNIQDVCGDKNPEMIFTDDNKLLVYSLEGKKMFEHLFSSPIDECPAFYRFSGNQSAIGVTDKLNSKIYLLDSRGQVIQGFPLNGKTRFSIGVLKPGNKNFNLIVGGNEQYLFNYRLN
jgi:hypothetical protein